MKTNIRHIILLLLCFAAASVSAQEHKVVVQASECDAPQTYSLPDGASLILIATASDNSHFTQWSDGNTDNPRTVTVTGDVSFSALFAPNDGGLSPEKYTATIYAGDCETPFVGEFAKGSSLKIVAEPKADYQFKQWSDGNTNNPRILLVTSDIELHAEFEEYVSHETLYNVTVKADGCSTPFKHQFYGGTKLVLKADSKEGYAFSRWSDGNTDNPRNVTVTRDATYIAEFSANKFTVTFYDYDGVTVLKEAQEVEKGKDAIAPADPERKGYKFVGWDKDFSNVQSDLIVKAKYAKILIGDHDGTEYEYIIIPTCEM